MIWELLVFLAKFGICLLTIFTAGYFAYYVQKCNFIHLSRLAIAAAAFGIYSALRIFIRL